jgi:hypothetical protein
MAKDFFIPIMLAVAIGSFFIGLLIGGIGYKKDYPRYPDVRDELHKYRIFMIQCAYYKETNTEIWKKCDEMYETLMQK